MNKYNSKPVIGGVQLEDVKAHLMKDEEFQIEYDELKTRYDIIAQIIEVRKLLNMTQEELARRAGTQKSNISRLESGSYNPSVDFLVKIARCLGKDLSIRLT